VCFSARFFDRGDLVEHLSIVALHERAAVDDHVDLVRARFDGASYFVEALVDGDLAAGEGRCDGCDFDVRSF